MPYQRRVVDDELDQLVPHLPAIAIEGPKAVGKTETALQRALTVYRLDDLAQLEVVKADPARLVTGDPPILIDEWQRFPASWDVVRRAVDQSSPPGQFVLTGSATPTDVPAHSGAGRITTVRMRPLTLFERGVGQPTVSLQILLAGERPPLAGATVVDVESYTTEICSSGFPGLRGLSGRPLRTQLDSYIERIIERDFEELGQSIRNEGALRRWMTAYAAATSTTASYEVIRDGATGGEADKPSKTRTAPYRRTLEQLWIIDEIPAWLPTNNRIRRLGQASRHHLVDPALATRLIGVDVGALLDGAAPGPVIPRDGTLLGALFESLVTLDTRVYAQAAEARVAHLRTAAGEHEVDLIVERGDGLVVAIEVKLARTVGDGDVRHLHWLAETIGPQLLDAIVVTTGSEAYRRRDGVGVVPAALLGP